MKKITQSIKKNRLVIKGYNIIFHRLIPNKIAIKWRFKKTFGFNLDLKNPKTLNEKLQWKKFYDHKNIYTLCADKYTVRMFIREKIGGKYLIPLLFHTNNPSKMPVNTLHMPFIIKSNHGSGQNIFIRKKEEINEKKILKRCKQWLKTNLYYMGKEWQYKNIGPKILIEKLLLTSEGKIPEDYKFHCFKGKVEFIQVDTDRFGNHKRSFFNAKWKLLPFTWSPAKNGKSKYKIKLDLAKPKNLRKMIKIAEKLSKDFDYVRVDLYSFGKEIYFGELTFSHEAGFARFFPQKWDKYYGNKLKLQTKNETKK